MRYRTYSYVLEKPDELDGGSVYELVGASPMTGQTCLGYASPGRGWGRSQAGNGFHVKRLAFPFAWKPSQRAIRLGLKMQYLYKESSQNSVHVQEKWPKREN